MVAEAIIYGPFSRDLDAREKRIAKELAEADSKQAEAEKQRDEFLHKNEEFNGQRTELLSQATEAANAERQRLIDVARQAAEASAPNGSRRCKASHRTSIRLCASVRSRSIRHTAQALRDLATASLKE